MNEERAEFREEIKTWCQKTSKKLMITEEEQYRRRFFRYVWGAIAIVVILSGTFWGAYQHGWIGWWPRTILNIFNLPVAQVGKRKIFFRDYLKERAPVEFFSQKNKTPPLSQSDISRIVLEKIIENEIIRILFTEKGMVINERELKEAREQFFPGISKETLARVSLETYHLSEKDFREVVIRPLLEREKLVAELGGETELQRAIQQFREKNEVKVFVK